MFRNKEEMKQCLMYERGFYQVGSKFHYLKGLFRCETNCLIFRTIKHLRKTEYYIDRRKDSLWCNVCYRWHCTRLQRQELRLGMELGLGVFSPGIRIAHSQGIVINGDAKIGKNIILHGANVVGNMGYNKKAPIIGDNVRMGVGSRVLGDVYIANNVQIGAGAVVLKSCYEEGALLTGIPAKITPHNTKVRKYEV